MRDCRFLPRPFWRDTTMRINRLKQTLTYGLFLLPALALFSVFFLYPFVRSFYLSLTDAYGYNPQINFIGLKNFAEALQSSHVHNSLRVTVIYTAFVTLAGNLTALLLAFLLDGRVRGKGIFRAIFFLPNLMSLVIVGFVWVFLYGDVYRSVISLLNIPDAYYVSWLGNDRIALFSMGIAAVWQCAGYYMLIYVAGLQGIPGELLEAAAIDGAGSLDIVLRIKLPMLTPVVFMNTILLLTAGFKTFDFPMVMTSGGPAGATTTFALLIYNMGFRSNRTGYATALSILLFVLIAAFTAVLMGWQNRREAGQ